ncbi:hypothetical protein H7I77_20200 [Mycolicibacterium novocastrense]|nr:hypothetical protein [Mycolicibacterium novocastrense]MCV7025642.1 hypothetical protein [Mycolicibacterium novocastrense]
MTKIIVTAGAIAATVAAIALFSLPGIASAAPDLVGQTYAEATNAIAQQGGTAIIASRVGAKLPLSKCIVTGVSQSTFVRPPFVQAVPGRDGRYARQGVRYRVVSNEYRLSLNCNAAVATANTPGNSAASPEGREAKREQEVQEWRRTAKGQQWCKQAEKEHPEWFPLVGCQADN